MSERSFIYEFNGIMHMLKEHEFLMYSNRKEFEEKQKAASIAFVKLVSEKTGLSLAAESLVLNFYGINSPTMKNAKQILIRAHRFYKSKAALDSKNRIIFESYAEKCKEAALLL